MNRHDSYGKIQFIPQYYKALEDIYCGANCEIIIANSHPIIKKSDLDAFKVKVLDFYIELCKQIQSRFNFDYPVLKFLKNFDPSIVVSGKCESLVPIATRFPRLVNNFESLNSEWRLLPDIAELQQYVDAPIDKFWSHVFNLRNGANEMMFPNLNIFMKGMLCLPHSSATVERTFSQLTLIKTKNRNRLHTETCSALLHTKELLDHEKCYDFKPSDSLLRRNIINKPQTNAATEIIEISEDEITF